jgi:hypothetical protein
MDTATEPAGEAKVPLYVYASVESDPVAWYPAAGMRLASIIAARPAACYARID